MARSPRRIISLYTTREPFRKEKVFEPAIERFSFVGMRLARTMPWHLSPADAREGNP